MIKFQIIPGGSNKARDVFPPLEEMPEYRAFRKRGRDLRIAGLLILISAIISVACILIASNFLGWMFR